MHVYKSVILKLLTFVMDHFLKVFYIYIYLKKPIKLQEVQNVQCVRV